MSVGRKLCGSQGLTGDDGVLGEQPALIANVDLRRRSADMKDQVPLAVRMHVEGTVQLIDRRAAEPAVEDGKRSAHALPPADVFCFFDQRSTSGKRMQG